MVANWDQFMMPIANALPGMESVCVQHHGHIEWCSHTRLHKASTKSTKSTLLSCYYVHVCTCTSVDMQFCPCVSKKLAAKVYTYMYVYVVFCGYSSLLTKHNFTDGAPEHILHLHSKKIKTRNIARFCSPCWWKYNIIHVNHIIAAHIVGILHLEHTANF